MDVPAFYRDALLTELVARVVHCGGGSQRPWVILDDTVLCPEGGGQPSDRGWIGDVAVTSVERHEEGIRHFLERPLPPGSPIVVRLDWERRFDHMQQHTAQHLLSAVAEDQFGWPTTAFHLGEQRADVELAVPHLSVGDLRCLEEAVMGEVRRSLPVRTRWIDPSDLQSLVVRSRGLPEGHSGAVRLVEIEGVDRSTCGGTHLANSAEIEAIHLLDTEAMRGGTRLYWVAGGRLRRRLAEHEERGRALRKLLDCADAQQLSVLSSRLEQLAEAKRHERQLFEVLAASLATELASSPGKLVERHLELGDGAFLQQVARSFLARRGDAALLLTLFTPRGMAFVLGTGGDSALDLRSTGAHIAELFGGRGGGGGQLFQGLGKSEPERRRAVVDWLHAAVASSSLPAEGSS